MAGRSIARFIGVAGTGLSGLWKAYAYWTTASQLPDDAGRIELMLTDPPVWLPWVVMASFVLFTAWAFFWPKKPIDDKERSSSGTYNQTHSGSGDNNMDF